MAEIRLIKPETAAHNIANAFCEKYVKSIDDPKVLSVDDKNFYEATKIASELYAHTYDVAYKYFSEENEKDLSFLMEMSLSRVSGLHVSEFVSIQAIVSEFVSIQAIVSITSFAPLKVNELFCISVRYEYAISSIRSVLIPSFFN